jgi:hypothetical protein
MTRLLMRVLGCVGVFVLLALVVANVALAGTPEWSIRSVADPSNFLLATSGTCEPHQSLCDTYTVYVTNVGTGPSSGPVKITDRLPHDVILAGKPGGESPDNAVSNKVLSFECTDYQESAKEASETSCTAFGSVPPGGAIAITWQVRVLPGAASSVTNFAEASEEGGARVTTASPETMANTVDSISSPVFGAQDFGTKVLGSDGGADVGAGDHPQAVVTTLDYATVANEAVFTTQLAFLPVAEPKTSIVDLPLGFAGDPLAAPTCPQSALNKVESHLGKCPAASVVGYANVDDVYIMHSVPIFNVVPEAGYPAEFVFEFDEALIYLRPRVVPSSGGYVLSVSVPDIPRSSTTKVTGVTIVLYGDPRELAGEVSKEAFLTNPGDCAAGPLSAKMEMDSWVDQSDWVSSESVMYEADAGEGVTGCGSLAFEPSLEVTPEEASVDTPSGYEVDLRLPQARNVMDVQATPDLKDATVSLPEGVSVSPSAADGLEACKEVGPEGINITHGWTPTGPQPLDPADPEAMEIGPDGLPHVAPGHCPKGSQVGTVEVRTPILTEPLMGHVYVAEPGCGGEGQPVCTEASASNGELFGLYMEVAGSGVIVKLKGTVSVNPQTGQLTTSFRENPQFPFSELKLRLDGGERAPLANPQVGGSFTTTSDLTPWSSPVTPDATPLWTFPLAGATLMPFAPVFHAAATSAVAAGSGSFTSTFSREDGEQDLTGVQVTLPPGLVGLLSEVVLCGEPQAREGKCGEESLIGTTTAAVGAGPHPYWQTGRVYLTGPYDGAPFGLSVVVPAKAGPFNLGDVVVRAAITINPETTAVTVTSGSLPQIVDGVPLRVRTINVLVDKSGFIVNPTNCEQMSVSSVVTGSQGAKVTLPRPFAVEGCKGLAFKPVFSASTQGKASKAEGASLDVRVSYPARGEDNIRSVKTSLPLQLPSRLTTLQKACLAAVFEANPADCPPESAVGVAKAVSPVLPVELKGPAYLVSHGNEKFPNLVIVLQGDGVRVNLVGDTDIKNGITTTTFKSVPDDPVSSFEVYLPEGKYSILGTYLPVKDNYNLCGHKLVMPTEIVGQNGAVIRQNTAIAVTGCKATKKPRAKKKRKKGKAKKSSRGGRS